MAKNKIRSQEELKKLLISLDPLKNYKFKPHPVNIMTSYERYPNMEGTPEYYSNYDAFNQSIREKVLPRLSNDKLKRLVNKTRNDYRKGHSIAWMDKLGIDPWKKSTISNKNELRKIIQYALPFYPPTNQESSIQTRRLKTVYRGVHNNHSILEKKNLMYLQEAQRLLPEFRRRLNEMTRNRGMTTNMRTYMSRAIQDFEDTDLASVVKLRNEYIPLSNTKTKEKRAKRLKKRKEMGWSPSPHSITSIQPKYWYY